MSVQFLEIPKTCPKCGQPTTIVTHPTSLVKTLWCKNPACSYARNQSLSHFVSRDAMNIRGLSEETLKDLMNAGIVRTASDIIKLPSSSYDLTMLDGWGERKVEKLYDAIEESMKVKLANFIYALGIKNVGLQTAKVIALNCKYELENFLNLTWSDLVRMDTIGDTIATSVTDWLAEADNVQDILDMLDYGLEIISQDVHVGGSLSGLTFCCTGAVYRFSSRPELKNYIESQGGKLAGSVSGRTNYLITNDTSSGSNKNKAAAALGVQVITEDQFIEMFGGK